MTVTLVGEVVNSADAVTGFSAGNISGDDDFVEGIAALGVKASAVTIQLFTTTLGASAPYDFSTGAELGYHIIGWFNTKTPINATTGLRFYVGDSVGGDSGEWYVVPTVFYKGGFVTKVIDTAADFDVVTGAWTLTGNPAQLTNIDETGMVFTTTTTIMGSFNNVQIDQFTVGTGVRVDAGTIGTPNTFEIVRAQDEDTSFWGWWSSTQGAIIGKGKCEIGPATGSATSVFTDTAFSIIFADERVATGFYEITTRGAGTDVDWSLNTISAANPTNARWSITIDSTTLTFADTNGVWTGSDIITLDSTSTLTGTTLINGNSLVQAGSTLAGITVLNANTADGVAYITSDNPGLISNSSFTFLDGHAIEMTTTGTYTFSGNAFSGYGADTTTDAALYNNSGGLITLNVSGVTPTVRNGAGASTTINNTINLTITGIPGTGVGGGSEALDSELKIYSTGTTTELDGQENVSTGSFIYSFSTGGNVDIVILNLGFEYFKLVNFPLPASNASQAVILRKDRNFSNPA